MQLPNELWYMIFKMRTRLILKEHYARWSLKHKEFNKKLLNNIIRLMYDDDHKGCQPEEQPYPG